MPLLSLSVSQGRGFPRQACSTMHVNTVTCVVQVHACMNMGAPPISVCGSMCTSMKVYACQFAVLWVPAHLCAHACGGRYSNAADSQDSRVQAQHPNGQSMHAQHAVLSIQQLCLSRSFESTAAAAGPEASQGDPDPRGAHGGDLSPRLLTSVCTKRALQSRERCGCSSAGPQSPVGFHGLAMVVTCGPGLHPLSSAWTMVVTCGPWLNPLSSAWTPCRRVWLQR